MNWPLSQDFNEAIQNPRVAFADPDLKAAEAVVGAQGLPLPRSGNFADVYQLRGANGRNWAVKCFTRPVVGLGDRYARVSEALARAKFPFTVEFSFIAEGIRVGEAWRPVVKMDWVEGLQLNQVVRENAAKPAVLAALLQMWCKLAKRLRDAGIAHADLQHGNVLLVPGSRPGAYGLKLIDYDGMYVPALANQPSGEVGHPAYQHPARASGRVYSQDADRFPHLVIATALKGLEVVGPALWERFDTGDNLLFTEEDFRTPGSSAVMKELWQTGHPGVQAFVGRLVISCTRPIPQTPWLDQFAPEGDPAPLSKEDHRQAASILGSSPAIPIELPPDRSAGVHPMPLPEEPVPAKRFSLWPLLAAGGLVLVLGGVGVGVLLSGNKPDSSETAEGSDQTPEEIKPKAEESSPTVGTTQNNDPEPPPPDVKKDPPAQPEAKRLEPIAVPPVGKLQAKERWSFALDEDPVSAKLVCSSDSRTVVAAGGSKRPTLALDLATGKPVPGSSNRSVVPAFPPIPLADGRFAIERPGGSVLFWDVTNRSMVPAANPFEFPERVSGRSFVSPSGEYLAFAGNRRTDPAPLRLKHIPTDRMILDIEAVNARVFFTADSSRVLVVEATGKCRWYKLPQGEPDGGSDLQLAPKPGPGSGASAMSADGLLLLFDGRLANRPQPFHLIDARTGLVHRSFAGNYVARSADLTRDGRLLAIQRLGTKNRPAAAEVISVATGKVVTTIPAPTGNTSITPTFVPDGTALVALVAPRPSTAQTLIRYDLVAGSSGPTIVPSPSDGSTWTVQLPESRGVHRVHVDLTANRAFLGGSQSGFTMLELATGQPRNEIPDLEQEGVGGFFPLRDGRLATIDLRSERIRIWDSTTGNSTGSIAVPEIPPGAGHARFTRAYLSPDARFLVVARGGVPVSDNPDAPFQVFDASSKRLLFSTSWKGGSAHFTGDSQRLLVAEWSGRFRWFKLPTGESDGGWDLGPPSAGQRHSAFGLSEDGSIIAYNGPGNTKGGPSLPGMLDGKSGAVLQQFKKHFPPTEPMISSDGRLAALLREISLDACTIEVVDVSTARVLGSVRVKSGNRLPAYALTPDGSALVVFNPSDRRLQSYPVHRKP